MLFLTAPLLANEKAPVVYKENYLLPYTFSTNLSDGRQQKETKFQISLQGSVFSYDDENTDLSLMLGYSQKSFWQIFDEMDSRPFRENNYNPEVFLYIHRISNFDTIRFKLGLLEHESNGREKGPYTRSWNRSYIEPVYSDEKLKVQLKIWNQWDEKLCSNNEQYSVECDENPEIVNFYGHGELRVKYVDPEWKQLKIGVMTRRNFGQEKGAIQIDVSLNVFKQDLFLYFQYWNGYGESLIDYNVHITKHGLGFMFFQ